MKSEIKQVRTLKQGENIPESGRGYYTISSLFRDTNYYDDRQESIKEPETKSKVMKQPKIHPEGHIDTQGHNKKYLSVMKRINEGKISLLPDNKTLLLAFISDAELGKTIKKGRKKKVSQARIVKYVDDLTKLDRFTGKSFKQINQNEMERFIMGLENGTIKSQRGQPFKQETIITTKNVIKKFYKWLLGESKYYPELVSWFDTSLEIPEYKAIKKEQIDAALSIITSTTPYNLARNRALIAILFDSGARADELLNVRLKHLTLEKGTYKLRIEFSKTLKRTIGLPLYTKYIDSWLDIHPARANQEAQLFPIGYQELRKMVKRIGKQLNFPKLTPHSFRHGSITYYANLKIFSDQQLKYRYGWSANSKQLSRYIDQEGLNQEEAVSQINVLQEQREVERLASENKILNQRLALLEEQMERLFAADKAELERIIQKVSKNEVVR